MYASRNIRLCNKDCVCLFVCPTGATDTENGQIDRKTCIDGCRLCVDACPSHAIYLVMEKYAEPEAKPAALSEKMMDFCIRKSRQEQMAQAIATASEPPGAGRLARALAHSARILAEDCAREAGYMIPESPETRALLAELSSEREETIAEIVSRLIPSAGE